MTSTVRMVLALWRSRAAPSARERWFRGYLLVLVAACTVLPVLRMVWLWTATPAALTAVTSAGFPGVLAAGVLGLWLGATWAGGLRGPALFPPMLTSVLATSDQPRTAFLQPVLRAALVLGGCGMLSAAVAGATLLQHGVVDVVPALAITLGGLCVGVIATVLWLAGQVLPRGRGVLAGAFGGLALLGMVLPGFAAALPWTWLGEAIVHGASSGVGGLSLLALAGTTMVPMLLGRLGTSELIAQAARWQRASGFASTLDVQGAAQLYQALPTHGRAWRAVPVSARVWLSIARRDAVGALRSPGRLLAGLAMLAAGFGLVALASIGTGGALVPLLAGLLVIGGLGPVTGGLRAGIAAAGDLPLYGISDVQLAMMHLLVPAIVLLVLTGIVVVIMGTLGTVPPAAVTAGAALGSAALLIRAAAALKGPLPLGLLAPVSTPVGDVGALGRMIWALETPLLAGAAGLAAAPVLTTPSLWLGVCGTTAVIVLVRWRARR